MSKEIRINGTQNFMGISIPIVEGGFAENNKCICDKTIADIHNMRVGHVRDNISNNIIRFHEGVDYIDLIQRTGVDGTLALLLSMGYAKQSITQAKHIYLLSERGYAKLIKIMDTDLAWEIHDKLIDEYFVMRDLINSNESLKARLLLAIYNGGQQGILASKELTTIEVEAATTPLLEKIEEDKPYTEFAKHVTESSDTVDIGEFAKVVKKESIKIGRNRLFEWLRDKGYLMSNNTPYQRYIESGYFKVVEVTKNTAYGINVYTKTLITGKGQVYFVEKLRKQFGIAP